MATVADMTCRHVRYPRSTPVSSGVSVSPRLAPSSWMARPDPRLAGYISEMDEMAAGCQRNDATPRTATHTARVQNEDAALMARYGTAMPSSDTATNMLLRPSASTTL